MPSNLSNEKFLAKIRIHKFGTKNALFCVFWRAILKNHCSFVVSALEFVLFQSLVQREKSLNLGPKMSGLGAFGLKF